MKWNDKERSIYGKIRMDAMEGRKERKAKKKKTQRN